MDIETLKAGLQAALALVDEVVALRDLSRAKPIVVGLIGRIAELESALDNAQTAIRDGNTNMSDVKREIGGINFPDVNEVECDNNYINAVRNAREMSAK